MSKKSLLEKIFSAPAEILETTVKVGAEIEQDIAEKGPVKSAKKYWNILGPGLVTGAADDDPSGIATYSQVGAQTGFGLIWSSLFSFPLMVAVQEMCARIGLATGIGLASNIKTHYSKKVLMALTGLLLFANIFNIGADLGAMAKAVQLLWPSASFTLLIFFFAITSLVLQIFVSYKKYSAYLKYLTFVLFAYVATALSVEVNWAEVLRHTFWPDFSFTKETVILLCAVLGTTISPYLFFWQSSQEVEEQILHGEKTVEKRRLGTNEQDIKNMRIDVISGMFVSNLVMFFIITACSVTLYSNGIFDIQTAEEAALALRPFAGDFAYVLFTLGILGTGLLAIPVLSGSSSYALAETFGWKAGLYRKLNQATSFYGVMIVSVLLGLSMNFVGIDPIDSLIYAALFNGIVSPVMIFFILRLSGDGAIMGKFKNGFWANAMGWLAFVLISLVGVSAVVSILFL